MPLKDEYRKERRRIQSYMNRMKRQGYVFIDSVLPPIPKNITAGSVARLQKITPQKIQAKANVVTDVGEVQKAKRGKKGLIKPPKIETAPPTPPAPSPTPPKPPAAKKKVMKREDADATVWYHFTERVMARGYTEGGEYLVRWIDMLERTYGVSECARSIQAAFDSGVTVTEYSFYKVDGAIQLINELNQFFKGSIQEIISESDLSDYLEDWEEFLE